MTRLEFHEALCTALGSRNVYFNPPEGLQMKFPAIVYKRTIPGAEHADDLNYLNHVAYEVTLIEKETGSTKVFDLLKFKMSKWNRHYVVEGMNHDKLTIYA